MMLENIEMLIEYRNLSVDSIFSYLSHNSTFSHLNFIDYISEKTSVERNYEKVFDDALSCRENVKNFDNEDIGFIKGYFSVIGKSDLAGQISNCRLYKGFFKQKLGKLEAEENIKCKSTGTFILGAGILIIIILI